MRFMHGLATLLAAITILVFAGSWLSEKYELGPNLGLFSASQPYADLIAAIYDTRVPVKAPAKLSIPVQDILGGRGSSWLEGQQRTTPLPVTIGPPQYWSGGFTRWGFQSDSQFMQGGGCFTPTVNLVRPTLEATAGKPVFARRVFIPSYAYFQGEDEELIFALVVDEDSDKDTFYTCKDNARFQIISLQDATTRTLERAFVPGDLSTIHFDSQARKFTFVERKEIGDKIRQRLIAISLAGELVSDEEVPDFLSEAKAAFERTDSE